MGGFGTNVAYKKGKRKYFSWLNRKGQRKKEELK
jgi:hypothetical protein